MKNVFIVVRSRAPSRLRALSAVSLAVCAAHPALAQSTPDANLGEVVVTASRNEQLLTSALPHTTVISRQAIERSQALDLVSLLQREAGLQRTQNGGLGSVSSVFLRGAPSLQTLVLIDGVPQNKQDASGSVSLEHLMLDMIERVEIVRGNVSAIYGSGAVGGVIQIFTRRAGSEPTADVTVEVGPRASRKASANVSVKLGTTSVSAGVSRLTSDGFSAVDTSQFPSANPDLDGYSNTSAHLSVVHQLSAAHSFGFRATRSDADTQFDNPYGAPADTQVTKTELRQTTLFTDNTWGIWRSRLSLSAQSDRNVSNDHGIFGSVDGFKTRATVLNWANTVAINSDWLASAGMERQRQQVDTSSDTYPTYNEARDTTAVFAGLEGQVGAGSAQLNARHDKVGSLTKSTGFLGYGYPLTTSIKATASVSSAFNAPPLGYLFAPGFGNPLLKPEQARSHEVGIQWEQGNQFVRASYFDTRITDQLNYDNVTSKFENIGRTTNSGLEVSYRGTLGVSDLRANLTLQDPVDEVTGQRLSRRAETLLSLGASYPVGPWRWGADLQCTGGRPDGSRQLGASTVLDLSVAYKASSSVMLKARLDNATDEKYQTVYGYNQQPRSLYVGLTWSPKL